MDRNQAKEFYPILQAFAEGRVIECRTKPSALSKSWQDMNEWTEMKELEYCKHTEYRIKPEPTYRPFKDAEECWQEMQKHQPVGWVKTKDKGIRLCMSGLNQKVLLHKLVMNMMKPLMNSSLPMGFRLA